MNISKSFAGFTAKAGSLSLLAVILWASGAIKEVQAKRMNATPCIRPRKKKESQEKNECDTAVYTTPPILPAERELCEHLIRKIFKGYVSNIGTVHEPSVSWIPVSRRPP